jgi:hypothetical protein
VRRTGHAVGKQAPNARASGWLGGTRTALQQALVAALCTACRQALGPGHYDSLAVMAMVACMPVQ